MEADVSVAQAAVLVLFPTARIARLQRFFLGRGFEASILSLSQELGVGSDAMETGHDQSSPLLISLSSIGELERLPTQTRVRLLQSRIVLHDVGKDLLNPKIEGEGPDWHIDPASRGGIKAAALSWLLDHLESPSETLWVNVFAGQHDAHGPAHYCSGRYGLTGFEAAVRLSSTLRRLALVNICLTYFADTSGAARCPDCLTQKHARGIRAEGDDDEAVFRYLERLYGQLPHDRAAPGEPGAGSRGDFRGGPVSPGYHGSRLPRP